MNKIQIVSTHPLVVKLPRVIPEKVEYDEINEGSINEQVQNIDKRIAEIRRDTDNLIASLQEQRRLKVAELEKFNTQEIRDAVAEFEASKAPVVEEEQTTN